MEKLLIATRNPGKFKELKLVFDDLPYDILSVDDLALHGDVVEDGDTYEKNAFKKARFFCSQTGGILTLADDSGLEVAALQGELGLTTRRWGKGENASDSDWLEHFLSVMSGVSDRSAKFVCYAALVGGGTTGVSFCAEVPGKITVSPEAPLIPGLPLSSCFKPDGCCQVYAALDSAEKGLISHRGWAASKAKTWLMDRGMNAVDLKIREIEKLTGEGNQYWICGQAVGEFLYKQVVAISAKTVLEFGTSSGYSALWMAKGLQLTGGRLLTVESHKQRGDLAMKHFEEAGVTDIVSLVRGHAPEVLTSEDVFRGATFDMAFFDATKYEHLSYFDAVYPLLRSGGVLVVDNVISHGDGNMMRQFLNIVLEHPGMTSEIIDIGSGILVGRKK